jgi:hypothetical protein
MPATLFVIPVLLAAGAGAAAAPEEAALVPDVAAPHAGQNADPSFTCAPHFAQKAIKFSLLGFFQKIWGIPLQTAYP